MNCKNCNKPLNSKQNFCDDCGAKVIRNRLVPKVLAQQVNQEFLSIDNKFLLTFIGLFTKPKDVIDGYINGTRKKYIGVIPYYAISLTVLGFQMFLLKNFFPVFLEAQDSFFTDGFKSGSGSTENPPFDFLEFFNDYQGVFFSILMPLLAVGTWIIYLDKRKYNYTEHLVINLYITAQTIYVGLPMYLLLAVFKIQNYLVASFIVTPPLIIYGTYVFNKLYRSSIIKSFIRYIAAYFIYLMVFSIIMFALTIMVILYLKLTGK